MKLCISFSAHKWQFVADMVTSSDSQSILVTVNDESLVGLRLGKLSYFINFILYTSKLRTCDCGQNSPNFLLSNWFLCWFAKLVPPTFVVYLNWNQFMVIQKHSLQKNTEWDDIYINYNTQSAVPLHLSLDRTAPTVLGKMSKCLLILYLVYATWLRIMVHRDICIYPNVCTNIPQLIAIAMNNCHSFSLHPIG